MYPNENNTQREKWTKINLLQSTLSKTDTVGTKISVRLIESWLNSEKIKTLIHVRGQT